jgi:hypothetical protein
MMAFLSLSIIIPPYIFYINEKSPGEAPCIAGSPLKDLALLPMFDFPAVIQPERIF